ncbi:MAG: PA0069 family radical SAM protein [Bacteroidota bacterium]
MSKKQGDFLTGRGAQINPDNRFQKTQEGDSFYEFHVDEDGESVNQKTTFIEVFPKTIVNKLTSPDVGMYYSLNPYQGCEHGCTYCYARPTHEYWGYSAGTDFERTILVKKNAPELLEETLRKKKWEVKPVSLSGNTDCYQPCERTYGITRKLLEIFLKYRHPVSIITKNSLIERDLDVLTELSKLNLVHVLISMTSLNEELRRKLEPRTASCTRKLTTIERLSSQGIPVTAMLAPIIPAINDHELFALVKAVSERGASSVHYQVVRLNGPNGEIFKNWLQHHYPDRAEKVIHQLEALHGGKVNDSRYGIRMKGEGAYSLNIERQFKVARERFLPVRSNPKMRTDLFIIPDESGQTSLF